MKQRSGGTGGHGKLHVSGVAAALALTALCYFAGVAPIKSRRAAECTGRDRLGAADRDAAAARAELAGARQHLDSLRRKIAASPLSLDRLDRMNARMADLNRLAGENGLEIDEIRPGSADAGPWFTRVPLRIAGNGPYRACMLFLHRLHREFPDMGAAALNVRGDPSTNDTPALFTFDLVWYAAPGATADATK